MGNYSHTPTRIEQHKTMIIPKGVQQIELTDRRYKHKQAKLPQDLPQKTRHRHGCRSRWMCSAKDSQNNSLLCVWRQVSTVEWRQHGLVIKWSSMLQSQHWAWAKTGVPGVHWPARLAKLLSSRFSERPCIKTEWRRDQARHSRLTFDVYIYRCAHQREHTHTHLQA